MDVLRRHRDEVLPHLNAISVEDILYDEIAVRRSSVLAETFRAFRRPTFTGERYLKVTFVGESAVDDGGPRRVSHTGFE